MKLNLLLDELRLEMSHLIFDLTSFHHPIISNSLALDQSIYRLVVIPNRDIELLNIVVDEHTKVSILTHNAYVILSMHLKLLYQLFSLSSHLCYRSSEDVHFLHSLLVFTDVQMHGVVI